MAAELNFALEPDWVAPVIEYASKAIEENPPCFPPTSKRHEALMVLDGPLHLVDANRFRSVHDFFMRRMTRTIEEIEKAKVDEGCRIWRLYNHGFVVRTPSVTIGIDLSRGWRLSEDESDDFGISPELSKRLVSQIDLLTLSHNHGDHCDPVVRDQCFEAGIPIFADGSIYPEVVEQTLLIRPERLTPVAAANPSVPPVFDKVSVANCKEIDMIVYPGHQAPEAINNVYLFRTAEGRTIMHTGDQSWADDFAWIDRVGDQHEVDVLITNCWTDDPHRVVWGIRPKIVITGHETEMAHEPSHREAYWRSFQIFRGWPEPIVHVLCWGEGVSL